MFYDTASNAHGLKHDPFKALVVPRPIGWVSTIGVNGVVNLAPFSYFNAVSENPPYVMFSAGAHKDSARNAEASGEFVCSLATYTLREAMNATSATVGPEVSEFDLAGLAAAPSRLVKPPRVAAAPAALECRYWRTLTPPTRSAAPYAIVFGEVVAIYIDDRFVKDGMVDTVAMQPIARMGYMDYAVVDKKFSMGRPR